MTKSLQKGFLFNCLALLQINNIVCRAPWIIRRHAALIALIRVITLLGSRLMAVHVWQNFSQTRIECLLPLNHNGEKPLGEVDCQTRVLYINGDVKTQTII